MTNMQKYFLNWKNMNLDYFDEDLKKIEIIMLVEPKIENEVVRKIIRSDFIKIVEKDCDKKAVGDIEIEVLEKFEEKLKIKVKGFYIDW
jgi:hypothetical protein